MNRDMKFCLKLYGLLVLVALLTLPGNIYVHEYVHYLQGSCDVENSGRGFFDRMNWGNTGFTQGYSLAYINVSGCETPERLNEWQPYVVNFIIVIILSLLVGEWFSKREIRARKYGNYGYWYQ